MKFRIRGDEVRRRRLELGLSQEQLAERCELSASAISVLERGTPNTHPRTPHELAKALGCEVADIAEIGPAPVAEVSA